MRVPVELLKLKTGSRADKSQKKVLVNLIRAKRFVWNIVIYVKKKTEGEFSHLRAITTQTKTRCTDISMISCLLCVVGGV